jgi:hypothetical protein
VRMLAWCCCQVPPNLIPARPPLRFVLTPVSGYVAESCRIYPPIVRVRMATPPRMQIHDIPRSIASPNYSLTGPVGPLLCEFKPDLLDPTGS